MVYAAGQRVRIRANGVVGRVFLRLPSSEVYLVQWPGFPLIEKAYYASDLEPVAADLERRAAPKREDAELELAGRRKA